jgi:PAS domain S-box-containing protein
MHQHLSCLLVSSQPGDRVLVEEALGQGNNHLRIQQTTDELSWKQALEAGDFNLGIIAEALPWADTPAVAQGLKSRCPECPVVMLAAPEREKAAWEALRCGVDDYVLTSPEEIRRLPAVVQAAKHRVRRPAGESLGSEGADLHTLLDAIPLGILVHDPESGRILDGNQEACKALGFTREELSGLDLGAITLGQPPYTQNEALNIIRKTIQEGPQTVEWLGRDLNRRPFWVEVTLKCLRLDGQPRVLSFARNITATKRAREALLEAEGRYETLLDSAGDAIFIHDTGGRLLQVNDAACRLLGYSRVELQQMTLQDIDAPDHPSLTKKIRESRHRGHVFVETALRRRDGTGVPVELSSRLVEYAGLPVAFNIARDMTERKEAEEKLRQSEVLYRSIFENTGTATCISDENTILRLVNEECIKLTGYSREELEGKKSWTEFIVPEDLERLKEYHRLRRLEPGAAPQSYTLRWLDRQGTIRDMLVNITLIPGTTNTLASLVDLTPQQQAEQALRESEERYRLLVETMNDGLGMQDENGLLRFANQRVCEMLGYAKEELLDRPVRTFMDPANQQVLAAQIERRRRGERQTYELTWTRKDGTPVITSISPVPIFDAGGKYQGSFAVITDITAQRQAEKALEESEEKYRAIFENTGTATAIAEEDHAISLANAEFVKLSGYSREELEGKINWTEFFRDDDLAKMQEYHRLRRVDSRQAPRNYEARFIDRQGAAKDVLMTVSMIPGTLKSVASILDITARKEAERELEYERKKFQTLTEDSPFALLMIDKDGAFKYVNPKFIELFGYTLADVPDGRTWFRKAYPDPAYRQQVIASWIDDLKRAKPGEKRPRTYTVVCQDGTEKIISFVPLQLENGDNLMTCEDVTERYLAVEAVKQSEQRFRLLMENSMVHLAVIDPQGTVLYENPTMERLLGYEIGELKGTNAFEFLHPEDLPRGLEVMRQLLAFPDKVVAAEVRYRHKDGSWRIMEVKAKNLLDEPVIRGIVVNTQDITERKLAEEAVRQSEQRFRLLMENSMVHLAIFDAQGTVLYENPTMERLLGYEIGELDGKNGFALIHPEDLPRAWEVMRQLLESPGKVFSTEVRYRHKDGSWRILEVKVKNLLNEPLIRGVVANTQDITERKEAEEAVRQSEQRFRLLMENSMVHLAIIDAQGTVIYENPSMESPLGYESGEFEGKNRLDLMHPEDLPRALEVLRQMLGAPGQVFTEEVRYRHKDGSWRWLEVKGKNLLDESLIRGIVTNIQDITQRKEMLAALRQSEERYRAIVEDQTELVSRFLADGTLTFVNETLCRCYGKTREELIGGNFYPYLPEDEQAVIRNKIAALNLDNPIATHEHQVLAADGRMIWLQLTKRAIFDDQGRIVEYQGVGRDITERKRAEEALRESERLHASILDTMPDLVYELTLDGQLIYANRTTSQALGYAPEELLKLKLEDLVDAEGLAHAQRVIEEMIASRQPSRPEYYQLRTAQGGYIPIETSAIMVERSNHPPTLVGVARDITARLQAEQALRQSEAEKSLILSNMSDSLVYYDRAHRILWANKAMSDFVGQTSEEMMGRFCYETLYQRHSPCPDCPVITAMQAGQAAEVEVIKSDGRILFYRSSPVKDENGEIQGNVLLVRDITARKKAEEAIKDSEEKMRLVIESSPVGIRITQQGRHIYVNPALMSMFGYGDPGEIVGLPVSLLFASDTSTIAPLINVSPGVKPGPSSYEAQGLKKDGARIEVQVWQTEIDYHGEPAILDFVLDISEAKDLRSQLLQAQKMEAVGTLAGGIAHDFNNILFPILVNAEMILESLAPHSVLRQRMERVFKACERAIDLVKQILAFSRQEERELSLVHLTPIIDDSLRLLRASLPATIEMRQHLDGAADTVLGDPTQIQQVLINLYTNAAHTLRDRGGVIDISLRELDEEQARGVVPPSLAPGPYLQLTVKDNGGGMDADTRERIFDPYFTTKKPGEGTGLGLAVVHGIIKRHGGAISVESELEKGSSFHIFLPRRDGETTPETEDPITLPLGRERILLVDDEGEIVSTLKTMLESLGYQVVPFTSSPAALDAFRAYPDDFDLVITDQTMPHQTGEEVAREILNLRPDLPIIICTGFSETMSSEKARAMGFRDFLIKPVATRVMAETIRRALMGHQDQD